MAKSEEKTKAPSGLSITRADTINTLTKNMKFSISWKIADKDYNDGQKGYYVVNPPEKYKKAASSKKKKKKKGNKVVEYKITLGKKTTKKQFYTTKFSDWYPVEKKKKLSSIKVFLQGNREKYEKTVKKKKKKFNPSWSKWAEKEYKLNVPPDPVVSEALGDRDNVSTFTFDLSRVDSSAQCFYDFYWESILEPKSNRSNGKDSKMWKDRLGTDQETHIPATANEGGYTLPDGTRVKFTAREGDKKYSCYGTFTPGETSGTVTIQEDASLFNVLDYSYTRWFRIKARGPAGDSKNLAYASHVYARPGRAENTSAEASINNTTGGLTVIATWDSPEDFSRPNEGSAIEYAIGSPEVYSELDPPVVTEDETQTRRFRLATPDDIFPGTKVADISGSGSVPFELNAPIHNNNCLFVRVVTTHDGIETNGVPIIAKGGVGKLEMPTGLTVNAETYASTGIIEVSADNNGVEGSYLAVYYRTSDDPNSNKVVGIIPWNETTVRFKSPDWGTGKVDFGVRALVADYSPIPGPLDPTKDPVEYTIGMPLMESERILWDGGSVPLPAGEPALSSPSTGTIQVKWKWTWDTADSAEISWANHEDAWESTDPPQTYIIENMRPSQWNISGLSTGDWWVRIRLIKTTNGVQTFGTYSPTAHIKLASAPDIPVLRLSNSIIPEDGEVTCYWVYSSEDGSGQKNAQIAEAYLKADGTIDHYSDPIASTTSEESITIKTEGENHKWVNGDKINLCVRVMSDENQTSKGYSQYVPLQIANPPTVEFQITGTCCRDKEYEIDSETHETETKYSLCSLPITYSVSGAGTNGRVITMIERLNDHMRDRPDEDEVALFAGEIIVSKEETGDGEYTIEQDDLFGILDDGESFIIYCTVTDEYNQTVSSDPPIEFMVNWDHQARVPSCEFRLDTDRYVTILKPIAPEDDEDWQLDSDDVCDIYRLSADKPELIVEGAHFGTEYVDPYPTLGSFGGHRIAFRSKNDDYTTDTGFAWDDFDEDDGNIHDLFATIIDFDNNQIVLPYDISLSSSWKKDFVETHYLGGSVEGDWNPGVSRTMSIKTTVVVEEDPEQLELMRRLADYPGICHVRTPEGSSFAADVQVNEDHDEKWVNRLAKFSLSITRVDPETEDGVTYAEWVEDLEE